MTPDDKTGRINKTRWFTCLFVWWVVVVFLYLFIAAKEANLIRHVSAAGIAIVQESAKQAGLPLLERDVQALTRLAQEVARSKGVINVSFIDHKNKIITFTNPDPLLPVSPTSVKLKDGVSYWHHTLVDGNPVVCFFYDISYAGTKIGEVFLAMDAEGPAGLITAFILAALVSFLMVVFTLLVHDFNGLHPLKAAIKARIRTWAGGDDALPDGRELICPVCGSHQPLTRSFLHEANLDRYPVVRASGNSNGPADLLLTPGVSLRELSNREDLGWLRRQMIHRCADIIKKLAGD